MIFKQIIFLACFIFIFLINNCKAQVKLKAQVGISYIEHFTTGIELSFKNKHKVSLIYGSDFFIKPQDFSSFMLQYESSLNRLKIKRFTPKIGVKGGYSIYTNKYYQWQLMALVPYIGSNYSINDNFDLAFDLGITFSREISMKRISYGEVGWYKEVLPEIKLAILYNL